jgi:hypothetical protein
LFDKLLTRKCTVKTTPRCHALSMENMNKLNLLVSA